MSIHVLRLPVRERPAGLMGRIWQRLSASPLRATARPARLRLDALSDATRRDLGLPPRSTESHR